MGVEQGIRFRRMMLRTESVPLEPFQQIAVSHPGSVEAQGALVLARVGNSSKNPLMGQPGSRFLRPLYTRDAAPVEIIVKPQSCHLLLPFEPVEVYMVKPVPPAPILVYQRKGW